MILKKKRNGSSYSIRWLDFYDSPETFGWLQFQDQSCFPSHSLECFYIRCLHQQQVRNENLKMKVLYISDIRSGQKLRKKTKILQTSSWPPLRFSSEVCHPPGRSSQELSWPGVQVQGLEIFISKHPRNCCGLGISAQNIHIHNVILQFFCTSVILSQHHGNQWMNNRKGCSVYETWNILHLYRIPMKIPWLPWLSYSTDFFCPRDQSIVTWVVNKGEGNRRNGWPIWLHITLPKTNGWIPPKWWASEKVVPLKYNHFLYLC